MMKLICSRIYNSLSLQEEIKPYQRLVICVQCETDASKIGVILHTPNISHSVVQ